MDQGEIEYRPPSAFQQNQNKPLPTPSPDQRTNSVAGIPVVKIPSMTRAKTSDRRVSMIDTFKMGSSKVLTAIKSPVGSDSVGLDAKDTIVFSSTTRSDRMANVCFGLYSNGYINGMFSDISVHVLGKTYNLHRIVLINNKYFALRMLELQGDVKPNKDGKYDLTIDMQDSNVTHEALQVVFARLYGYFEDRVKTESLKSLLATAHYFHDSDLCDMCADFIKTIKFSPQNALDYINYSSTFDYGDTSVLFLRHVLIYLCREATVDKNLQEVTFPQLEFSWLARIVQSDTFYILSEFERFEFIRNVLTRKFETEKFGGMKGLIHEMTSHVLALGRLPVSQGKPGLVTPPQEPVSQNDVFISAAEQAASTNVVFLGKLATVSSPSLPPTEINPDHVDAAINLLSKGLLYAHIPLAQYDKIRTEGVVPGFVFDRHFRIHHDMIRLVETTPKGIQKLGVAYHYNRKNVVVVEGEPEGFFDVIMGQVYKHDLLEMPPFRFGVEFGGVVPVVTADSNGKPPAPGNALLKVLKGIVGESLLSRGVPYAGSLWSVKIEKSVDEGVNNLEVLLVRKTGSKDSTICIDSRPEAKFWCRIITYVSVNSTVTEAYTFESTGVSFLNQPTRIGQANPELFKELYVAGTMEPNTTSVRLAVLLGVL
ncbi:UNVERIFIED_CONTAM: hypothetical protein HDU68_005165 [Siphonaria sp. JEL0065]|nr:hypothetical protein HDU68_005165 [Siphonaria sp. JEL0065]